MFLKSLHVENFRSFKNLEVRDFKKVNLLVGENGCGKSSLLDAVFLLIGGKNPVLTVTIQNFREMMVKTDDDFRCLFNDFKIDDSIRISAETFDNKRMELGIKANIGIPLVSSSMSPHNEVLNIRNNIAETNQSDKLSGMHYNYVDTGGKVFNCDFSILYPLPPLPKDVGIRGLYLNDSTMRSMQKTVNDIIINKDEAELITVLQEIDSDITGIKMGAHNTAYIDIKGKSKLMPINVMGDGIVKIVSVLAGIRLARKGGIVLVDEIENGLHYTSLQSLWKAVLKACQVYDVQMIATTHSYECIEVLAYACTAGCSGDKLPDENVSLIRLDKIEDRHVAVSYPSIKAAVENRMEVR
jgi:AAA15 family ATPase/GTPase